MHIITTSKKFQMHRLKVLETLQITLKWKSLAWAEIRISFGFATPSVHVAYVNLKCLEKIHATH